MAGVTLQNVKKMYANGTEAVKDFTMEIADNEFVVLVGPSGCGKSTLLRMIAGLEDISGGEIYIGDRLVNQIPPKDRDISMVFQDHALYPHFTVYDNLAFPLKIQKEKKGVIREKVTTVAAMLGISDLLKRKPNMISGGEAQRVAIGRALIREPQVFLMDEPLSNLDAKLRLQMRLEILRMREMIETTFIYVTHDQIEAMALGDRIVVMKDGYIQQIGTPSEIYQRPENTFVASFIGSPPMNLMDGSLLRGENGWQLKLGESACGMSGFEMQEPKESEQAVIVGVRPNDLKVNGGDIWIDCVFRYMEELGDETHIYLLFNDNVIVAKTLEADMLRAFSEKTTGDPATIGFHMADVHLFDAVTGQRL